MPRNLFLYVKTFFDPEKATGNLDKASQINYFFSETIPADVCRAVEWSCWKLTATFEPLCCAVLFALETCVSPARVEMFSTKHAAKLAITRNLLISKG